MGMSNLKYNVLAEYSYKSKYRVDTEEYIIGEGGNFMQRKKRTKSKLVKRFMNFLLAIALGISLLQLPQLSKEVKAENVNTNNGKQSQEMAGSYYLDKNRTLVKKL